MRISAPNYTQAPNVFFDELFKTLTEGELRIVLVLVRQTFGWHKEYDKISLSQISKKTGMERKSVCRCIASLIKKGLIEKKKFGDPGKERCWYSLIIEAIPEEPIDSTDGIETEEEMALISNSFYQCPKDTPPVSVGHPPSVLKTPTKETHTKETIQKKQQHNSMSVPAAAVFSSKNSSENAKTSVYPILDQIDIPLHDKQEITRDYSMDDVAHAIKWATHPSIKLNKELAAAIKWACRTHPTLPQEKRSKEDLNKEYAMRYNGQSSECSRVDVLTHHVEITHVASNQVICVGYEENGFMDQFTNALRKHKFKVMDPNGK